MALEGNIGIDKLALRTSVATTGVFADVLVEHGAVVETHVAALAVMSSWTIASETALSTRLTGAKGVVHVGTTGTGKNASVVLQEEIDAVDSTKRSTITAQGVAGEAFSSADLAEEGVGILAIGAGEIADGGAVDEVEVVGAVVFALGTGR